MQKKRIILIAGILLAAVVAVTGGLVYWKQKNTREKAVTAATVVPWDLEIEEEKIPESEEKIFIPGYSRMVMKANTKQQTVSMGNPSDNDCYFVIVLQLEDGTELFKSDYLKPGEGYEQIVLNQELEPGEYQAVVRYYCYTLEDKSALNGGSCEFQLIVE